MKSLLDVSALIVSFAALAVTIYFNRDSSRLSAENIRIAAESGRIAADSANSSKSHNELSLRPLLDFQTKLSIGPGPTDGGYVRLVNLGEGPAVIRKIKATYQETEVETSARSLYAIGGQYGLIASDLREKQVIAKGGEAYIFRVSPANFPASEICPRDRQRKLFVEKLRIIVEYESLYHIVQSVELRYTSPNTYSCEITNPIAASQKTSSK